VVTIRAATVADAAAISAVQRAAWFAAYEGIVQTALIDQVTRPDDGARVRENFRLRPWQRTLVAVGPAADGVVGYASFGPERDVQHAAWPPPLTSAGETGSVAELYALYVHPGWWSAGAGRGLMEQVLGKTAVSGFKDIVLWVLADNARARRFYERAGFATDGGTNVLTNLGGVLEVRYRRTPSV